MPPWWYSSPYLQTHWRFPRLFGVFPFCEMPQESWGLNLMISDFAWEYGIPQPSNFPRFKASSMEKNMAAEEMMKLWNDVLGEPGEFWFWVNYDYISPTFSYLKVRPILHGSPWLHYLWAVFGVNVWNGFTFQMDGFNVTLQTKK